MNTVGPLTERQESVVAETTRLAYESGFLERYRQRLMRSRDSIDAIANLDVDKVHEEHGPKVGWLAVSEFFQRRQLLIDLARTAELPIVIASIPEDHTNLIVARINTDTGDLLDGSVAGLPWPDKIVEGAEDFDLTFTVYDSHFAADRQLIQLCAGLDVVIQLPHDDFPV